MRAIVERLLLPLTLPWVRFVPRLLFLSVTEIPRAILVFCFFIASWSRECCFATCCQLRPSGICSGLRTQLCLLRILSFRLEACFLTQILRANWFIFILIDLSKVISEEIACKDYPYSYNSPDSCTHKYRLFSFHHFRSILTRLFKSLGISILYSRLVDST